MKELEYSKEFLAAWRKYPHLRTRSQKKESYKRWVELDLDANIDNVLAWIKAGAGDYSEGWQPGFQVVIKKVDFSEPPQAPQQPKDWSRVPSVQAHVKALAAHREAEKARLRPVRDLAAEIFEKNKGWASYRDCIKEAERRLRNQG